VTGAVYLGSCTDITVRLADEVSVRVRVLGSAGPEVGTRTRAWIDVSDVLFLPADGSDG
jgi:hypothetical protein